MDKLTSPQIIRNAAGRFVKGCSGNYRGRPKIHPQLRRLARENIESAIIALEELCDSKNDKIRCLASVTFLELAMNQNLWFQVMKRSKKSVWQYLFLRTEPVDPFYVERDPRMRELNEIYDRHMTPFINKLTRIQQQIDSGVLTLADDAAVEASHN